MASLETIVTELSDLHTSITHNISYLSKLTTDNEKIRSDLALKIHNQIRQADSLCEIARLQLQEESDGLQKEELKQRIHELTEEVKLDRSSYRRAQLASRRATISTRKSEREQLLASNKTEKRFAAAKFSHPTDRVLKTAEDATESLRRTHQLLEAELAKSNISLETLDESSTQLRKLTTQYTAFDVVLGTSRKVINVLEQADRWDRIYMLASLGFLLLVLVWVFWRRVFRGPVKLLIWTFFKGRRIISWALDNGESTSLVIDEAQDSTSKIVEEFSASTSLENAKVAVTELVDNILRQEL
ncbi:Sec20-domain-containing protein [Lipomyces japonicus]|uniref:Sec20-domain-containing protein n=1 Tax=Lipomyces japonicus TaxID=56871 RepID=UPI0034CEE852